MPITDDAICLRRSDYSETSLIVRLLTRGHGQVALMAKGVKRPRGRFGGSIDLLAVGQAVFVLPRENSVSTMGTLTAWEQTAMFPCLRSDLLRHAVAMTAGELLGRLTEELDPHPASFEAMIALLQSLQGGDPPVRMLARFGRELLADIGLTPNLARCVGCGSPTWPAACGPAALVRFSGPRAGALCPACPAVPGENTVAVSRGIQDFLIDGQLSSGKLALAFVRWLVYHVQHQLGRPLNSADTLERAIQSALAALAAAKGPCQ